MSKLYFAFLFSFLFASSTQAAPFGPEVGDRATYVSLDDDGAEVDIFRQIISYDDQKDQYVVKTVSYDYGDGLQTQYYNTTYAGTELRALYFNPQSIDDCKNLLANLGFTVTDLAFQPITIYGQTVKSCFFSLMVGNTLMSYAYGAVPFGLLESFTNVNGQLTPKMEFWE
jgi:hypothetical protein